MKTSLSILFSTLLCCTFLVGSGCGGDNNGGIQNSQNNGDDTSGSGNNSDDNSSDATATTPKIAGQWTGRFGTVQTSTPQEQPITASIRQNGSMVVITTSLTGVGSTLTGTIEPDGEMRMTDPFDGETWTTYFGPANSQHVQVADFLYDTELGAASPLQVIDLVRAP